MDRWHVAASGPYLLGAGRLGDLESFLEVGVPQRDRVMVEAVHDLAERHAELVLVARELDAVLDVRHFLAERPDAGQPARGAFHESRKVGTEQVETGIGIAAEVAGLLPGAGDDEGAAERPLVAGLAIALVGHVFAAG